MNEGIRIIEINTWLQVIPQFTHFLLLQNQPRRREKVPQIKFLIQCEMCSEELIRVAILWHEQWYEGLEEASRLYFGERDIKGMFETLAPLHAMLERGPQTLKETSFNQAYGRELSDALEWCNNYKVNKNYLIHLLNYCNIL
jgi:phosphatidylinositol kinase/protein kinase (PI-3  family)